MQFYSGLRNTGPIDEHIGWLERRNDAVGIARIMQCGWYKEVRVMASCSRSSLGWPAIVARFASAYALNRTLAQSPLRQFGGGLSVLILAAASVVLLLALAGSVRRARVSSRAAYRLYLQT
jgi:hypothetical protein